ncbi:MAG: hypothetical protein KA072_01425 [Thermoanaerobaculaceae bacterium]|nr:hypothetical protein [Thermoanaerobaculaceae bacterium]MDI9620607.1 hypothetical protein [Acidobacteriota bacterium]NLH10216.1 hypothetical protein [Holophagae bacterium]HPW55251.1 hypothetical protein [Thermoanaerobaculaceae bacterium]
MPASPLSLRVVLLSLGVALIVWPLVWFLLAAAQGVGTTLAGGDFIGVSLPLGRYPWALVNQPEINFASTRAGLWGYWLPSAMLAVVVAVCLPVFAPGSRRWGGELALLHVALASAVLGLGWAPALGCLDGPALGLERFFHVPSLVYVGGCALVGACGTSLTMIRLAGGLWHHSSPVTRRRRVSVVLLHGLLPLGFWLALTILLGWRPGPLPLAGVGTVLFGALGTLFQRVPRAELQRRDPPSTVRILLLWPFACAVLVLAAWTGAPQSGAQRGYLWGKPLASNNIRPEWRITPLRQGLVRPGQSERAWVP